MRNPTVKGGDIVSSPDGSLWCVVALDDKKVVLRRCDDEGVLIGIQRGGERREVSWEEWAKGWELRFP
jgi:NMD protein affecting ribosome stability and mRNA decay